MIFRIMVTRSAIESPKFGCVIFIKTLWKLIILYYKLLSIKTVNEPEVFYITAARISKTVYFLCFQTSSSSFIQSMPNSAKKFELIFDAVLPEESWFQSTPTKKNLLVTQRQTIIKRYEMVVLSFEDFVSKTTC